jgi:hypothetical protein
VRAIVLLAHSGDLDKGGIVSATIPPLDLTVGQRYQWRASIGGEMHEDWLAGFTVTGQR